MGCHFLIQGIFSTQGSNLCLLKPLSWNTFLYSIFILNSWWLYILHRNVPSVWQLIFCNIESLVPCKEKRSIPVYTSKKHVSKDIIMVTCIRLQQPDIKSHSGLEEPSENLHMSFYVLDNLPGLLTSPTSKLSANIQATIYFPGVGTFKNKRNWRNMCLRIQTNYGITEELNHQAIGNRNQSKCSGRHSYHPISLLPWDGLAGATASPCILRGWKNCVW